MRILPMLSALALALSLMVTPTLAQTAPAVATASGVSDFCGPDATSLPDCQGAVDALLGGATGGELQNLIAALVTQLTAYYQPGIANPLLAAKIAYIRSFATDPTQIALIDSIANAVETGGDVETAAIQPGALASPN